MVSRATHSLNRHPQRLAQRFVAISQTLHRRPPSHKYVECVKYVKYVMYKYTYKYVKWGTYVNVWYVC